VRERPERPRECPSRKARTLHQKSAVFETDLTSICVRGQTDRFRDDNQLLTSPAVDEQSPAPTHSHRGEPPRVPMCSRPIRAALPSFRGTGPWVPRVPALRVAVSLASAARSPLIV
jgi:hypothetical protein